VGEDQDETSLGIKQLKVLLSVPYEAAVPMLTLIRSPILHYSIFWFAILQVRCNQKLALLFYVINLVQENG